MGVRFGFVSTYPPTRCGIATFNRSLMRAISNLDGHVASVVRLMDSPIDEDSSHLGPEIVSTLLPDNPEMLRSALRELNTRDIAVIQHEFGIFGGADGDEAISILQGLHIPSIVVLHTVLSNPTWHQREVLTEICRKSSAVVTMSEAARKRLVSKYFVEPAKIFPIPHGSAAFPLRETDTSSESPLILTWGLIGPGKGIEWAIEAMGLLRNSIPSFRYIVAGRTHPKVLEREGEAYRESLQSRIEQLGLQDVVELRSEYLDDTALADILSSASIVLLPYDSTEQVTSGVLIEAITARRPVVATDFPHAVELLSQGIGLLVPHHDSEAIAEALREILDSPEMAREMSQRAGVIATRLLWPAVAARYIQLAKSLIRTTAVA